MKTSRSSIIDRLAAEPAPTRFRRGRSAVLWLLMALVGTTAAVLLTGPLRPGALAALTANPQFVLEMGLGLAAIVITIRG